MLPLNLYCICQSHTINVLLGKSGMQWREEKQKKKKESEEKYIDKGKNKKEVRGLASLFTQVSFGAIYHQILKNVTLSFPYPKKFTIDIDRFSLTECNCIRCWG